VWWFEVHIEEWGLKHLFEGINEGQKLDLRLKLRYNCRFWRISSTQLWGHFTPNESPRSDILVLFSALFFRDKIDSFGGMVDPTPSVENAFVKLLQDKSKCEKKAIVGSNFCQRKGGAELIRST
jgi:hypothetical protein